MINRIKAFFDTLKTESEAPAGFQDRHVAVAALLVEAAGLDGEFDEGEARVIRGLLERKFDFSPEELDSLMEEGRRTAADTTQIVRFTQAIKDACSYEERVEMMEMLWEVVYADGELHHYESNLLRRVGGLLYVDDRDRGAARKRVRERLGLSGGSEAG